MTSQPPSAGTQETGSASRSRSSAPARAVLLEVGELDRRAYGEASPALRLLGPVEDGLLNERRRVQATTTTS